MEIRTSVGMKLINKRLGWWFINDVTAVSLVCSDQLTAKIARVACCWWTMMVHPNSKFYESSVGDRVAEQPCLDQSTIRSECDTIAQWSKPKKCVWLSWIEWARQNAINRFDYSNLYLSCEQWSLQFASRHNVSSSSQLSQETLISVISTGVQTSWVGAISKFAKGLKRAGEPSRRSRSARLRGLGWHTMRQVLTINDKRSSRPFWPDAHDLGGLLEMFNVVFR